MIITDFTQVPLGTILPFVFGDDLIPEGWLKCDGIEIPVKYKTLRELLGLYTPNFAGRTLIGSGMVNNNRQSDGTFPNFVEGKNLKLYNTGGEYQHQLTINEMPRHQHTINKGNFGLHSRSFSGSNDSDIPFKTNAEPSKVLSGTDSAGSDGFHNTMQPYYVVNYIIYAGGE